MKNQNRIFFNIIFIALFLAICLPTSIFAQKQPLNKKHKSSKQKTIKHSNSIIKTNFLQWNMLEQGMYYTQLQAPRKTKIGDYKVDILKVDPKLFDFELNSYVMHDTVELTAPEWSAKHNYLAVINAGMYSYSNPLKPVGFMKSNEQLVNPRVKDNYKAAFVFGTSNTNSKPAQIVDLEQQNGVSLYQEYSSALQSIRMLDGNGQPVMWKSKTYMRCSMGIIGQDKDGFIYLIFARSPIKPNEMSIFLSKQPLGLIGLMYLEGGPETSYVINHPKLKVEKMGCYVSRTWPRNNCTEFRKIPQVIGVKRKA
jgi:hypothetical protein